MKRAPTVSLPLALALLVPFASGPAHGQGQAMPPIKVDLPPPPGKAREDAAESGLAPLPPANQAAGR